MDLKVKTEKKERTVNLVRMVKAEKMVQDQVMEKMEIPMKIVQGNCMKYTSNNRNLKMLYKT